MIIAICGSSRFKNEILEMAKNLTLDNHIVLTPAIFEHSDEQSLNAEQKIRLDNLQKEKINMSDAIFVVNVDGYIGESTYGEIDWAQRMKKEVYFLVNPNNNEEQSQSQENSTVIEQPIEVTETFEPIIPENEA